MGEHDDHRQRVYARALREGMAGFEEHNALEMLLFYCHPRMDTNALAHRLIARFGSFAGVLDAPLEELADVKGMGPVTASKVKLLPEICAYYQNSRFADIKVLDSVHLAVQYCAPKFFGKTQEMLLMVSLDDKRRVLRCTPLSNGSTNATAVSVPQVVGEAIKTHATGVLLAHNHPRGLAAPSPDDIRATMEVYKALNLVNIKLVDHLIFADDEHLSMAGAGYLQNIKESLQVQPYGQI